MEDKAEKRKDITGDSVILFQLVNPADGSRSDFFKVSVDELCTLFTEEYFDVDDVIDPFVFTLQLDDAGFAYPVVHLSNFMKVIRKEVKNHG